MHPQFILSERSVLRICKTPISLSLGLANHYYLSEYRSLSQSLSWGPNGLETRGRVRLTTAEIDRVEEFISAAPYNVATNNCEHFSKYVLYGLNLSSQTTPWWKDLGAAAIAKIQPANASHDNVNAYIGRQVQHVLKANLRQAKINKANQNRIDFWASRGIELLPRPPLHP